MKSEDTALKQEIETSKQYELTLNQKQIPPVNPIQMPPGNPPQIPPSILVVNSNQILPSKNLALPFDVENDLSQFTKVYITRDFDFFRSIHCFEMLNKDYIVYGLLPDGDKKLIFTSRGHFKCCNFCEDCSIPCCCCEYVCCNRIIFQMDYKRNGNPFYTQGVNIQKGCYCCKCNCCQCCCCCCCCCCNCSLQSTLYLRENIDPDNPDFNVGTKKGQTVYSQCCGCCSDSVMEYTSQEGLKGHSLRLSCCEVCKHKFRFLPFVLPYCCIFSLLCCKDIEIDIESPNGLKTGIINMPNGCLSERKEIKSCCFFPNHHYEINFPPLISSVEKFQIITEAIHLDLQIGLL